MQSTVDGNPGDRCVAFQVILNAVASFFNALAIEHNVSTHLKLQWRTTVPTARNKAHMAFPKSWCVVPLKLTQI
jgi:hypothetical protein